ncbi:AcrR family transcriptional regulator [Flavobacterium nitrogenifigens]|uniref:AcrR family transcriptional regulator n=2 Tax=Flavobacterium TaxID=237 RepID=A0A7W7J1S0_9FLAO|nr:MULTISPECIES: TetR/AcrR family transcriptional regulator [Flavobacterium]MBB4804607.1 AcrR family transcriptional regulator [Flavobacterium nitrogenifigens]MBB6389566.1 AcrR family transcriptional regulator [Flavobacterium notoginsengisoli]
MSKAERTRQFIIEAAAPIINKKGMAGTSMSDIMEATKLAKGGIYGNFESKEEICMEAFLFLRSQLASKLDLAVAQGKSAQEKLFNLLDVYKNDQCMMEGCPILNFGTEADDTNPLMKEHVKKAAFSAQKRYLTILEEGIKNKELSAYLNAAEFSVKIFALVEGAILCGKIVGTQQMDLVLESIKNDFKRYVI